MSEPRGIALFAGTAAEVIADAARAAEGLGYSSFWLNHPGATDGVGALAGAAQATVGIELGVGVVPLHTRPAASVVESVRANHLPADRLLLGIGTAGAGAFALARQGAALIRSELGCAVVMGALAEPTCRLAGRIADGVLFNWLTPAHARRSARWVEEGAAAAGRPRPRLYAYVRVGLGPTARQRVIEEGGRYGRGSYAAHFERMGVDPVETAIAAAASGEVAERLGSWEGAVDEVVLRLLPESPSLQSHLELIEAGAP